jgi:hypothetical protein
MSGWLSACASRRWLAYFIWQKTLTRLVRPAETTACASPRQGGVAGGGSIEKLGDVAAR